MRDSCSGVHIPSLSPRAFAQYMQPGRAGGCQPDHDPKTGHYGSYPYEWNNPDGSGQLPGQLPGIQPPAAQEADGPALIPSLSEEALSGE